MLITLISKLPDEAREKVRLELLMVINYEIFKKLEKEDISLLRKAVDYDAKANELMGTLKKFGKITSSNKVNALMSVYSLLLKGWFKIELRIILIRRIFLNQSNNDIHLTAHWKH